MNYKLRISVLLIGLILVVGMIWADGTKNEIPELKGTWVGESKSVIFGKLEHREETDEAEFGGLTFTIEIKEQEGRVFHGVRYSKKHSEDIVGFIGMDNTSIYIADHDGYMFGNIKSDVTLEIGYLEAGNESRVAAVAIYNKK